jgi:hypothetical protein
MDSPEALKADVDAGTLTLPQAKQLVQREEKRQGVTAPASLGSGSVCNKTRSRSGELIPN